MESPKGPVKVKSSTTIDMFFKSPPKQQAAKPVVKSPTILGYFMPNNSKTAVVKGTVNGVVDDKKAEASKSSELVEKQQPNGVAQKKKSAKRDSNSKLSKSSKSVKGTAKSKVKSSSDKGSKTNREKTANDAIPEKNGVIETADDDDGEKDGSLKDFDTTKPEKSKSKKRKKMLVIEDDEESDDEPSLSLKPDDVASKDDDGATDKEAHLEKKVEVSYQDFIESEVQENKGDDDVKEESNKEITKAEDEEEANTSVTVSYADFLSQESEDEEDEQHTKEQHNNMRNDIKNNLLSTELSDVDMKEAADDSQESMDTGVTSDEDVFQDGGADSAAPQESNSHNPAEISDDDDTVMTVSLAASPEPKKSAEELYSKKQKKKTVPTAPKDHTSQKKQKFNQIESTTAKGKPVDPTKKPTVPLENKTTDSPPEDDIEEDDLDIPKRKEVKVTAQIHHTPPLVTPSASPSSSSSRHHKSNVVVDSAGMDHIHVEESDVASHSLKKKVKFVSSGSCTPPKGKASSSDTTIKPAPTKLFDIFQKKSKSAAKESSTEKKGSQPKKASKAPQTTKMVDPVSKQTTFNIAPKDDGKQGNNEKTVVLKKTSESKIKETGLKTTENETTSTQKPATDKAAKTQNNVANDPKTEETAVTNVSKGKRKSANKLSLRGKDAGSKSQEASQKTESDSEKTADKLKRKAPDVVTPQDSGDGKRRLSGRAAAAKARQHILQQEIQDAAGSESATSQEDVPCPKKRTLKELFPSDNDGSGDDRKVGQQAKLKQSRILVKQKTISSNGGDAAEKKNAAKSPGRNKKDALKLKSLEDEEDKLSPVVKRKRGRPSKEKPGPIMTSSPKVTKVRKLDVCIKSGCSDHIFDFFKIL